MVVFYVQKMPAYSSHAGKLPHKLGKTDKDTSISGSIKQVALKYQDVIAKQMKDRMKLSEGRGKKREDQMVIPFSEPTNQRKELAKIIFMKYG